MTDRTEFERIANHQDPESEQQRHQPRLSHKALLAALMIFTYHQEPQFQRLYEMLGLFIEVDGLMSSWRRTYTRNILSFTEIYKEILSIYRRARSLGSTSDRSQVRHRWHRWIRLSHQNTVVSILSAI